MQPEEPEHTPTPNASTEPPAPAAPSSENQMPARPSTPASEAGISPTEFNELPTAMPGIVQPTTPPAESTPPMTAPEPILPQGAAPVIGGMAKKRWLMPAIVAAIALVLLGGGYVFAFYLPNQPDAVFKRSLKNTADGYDSLISYSRAQADKHYKGSETSGTLKLSSKDFAADGDFSLKSSGNNLSGTFNIDLAGEKLSANIRSLVASGQTIPDTYVQVNGVKPVLDQMGLSSFDNLDGQWVAIDHTLLETMSNSAMSKAGDASTPTGAQIQDALTKIGTVNRDYLLSGNSSKAVLVNQKYLGKSKQDGRNVYGYSVHFDKAHFKTYVSALGTALDSSSLNTWVKQMSGGKQISDIIKPSGTDVIANNYTFTLYVDAKTKLPHAVRFPDASNPSSYFQLGLNYTGGHSYPFTLKLEIKNGDTPVTLNATATLDTTTSKLSVDSNVTVSGSAPATLGATFTTMPSNQTVQVTAPTNAKPIHDVLSQFALSPSGFLGGSSTLNSANLLSL